MDIKKLVEEKLHEFEHRDDIVINLPMGTAMSLASKLPEVQSLLSRTYQYLTQEQGMSSEEAMEEIQEVKKALEKPEVKEAFHALQEAEEHLEETFKNKVVKPSKTTPSQRKNTSKKASSSAKEKNSKASIPTFTGFSKPSWETHPLLMGIFLASQQADPEIPLSTRGKIYEKVVQGQERVEKLMRDNPRMAKALGWAVKWGGNLAQLYAYGQAAVAGAEACAVGGPWAAGACAVGSMGMLYMAQEGVAHAAEKGVDTLKKDAAAQGRTSQEKTRFEKGVQNAAQNILIGSSLAGIRGGLKKTASKTSGTKDAAVPGKTPSSSSLKPEVKTSTTSSMPKPAPEASKQGTVPQRSAPKVPEKVQPTAPSKTLTPGTSRGPAKTTSTSSTRSDLPQRSVQDIRKNFEKTSTKPTEGKGASTPTQNSKEAKNPAFATTKSQKPESLDKAFSRAMNHPSFLKNPARNKPEVGKKGDQRVSMTYTKTHKETGQVYTGRTSGKADINDVKSLRKLVARRDKNHHMNEKGFGPAQLDQASTNPHAVRGREQIKIDQTGGAQKQGGTSGNTINGIRDKNPKRDMYIDAAKKEFKD